MKQRLILNGVTKLTENIFFPNFLLKSDMLILYNIIKLRKIIFSVLKKYFCAFQKTF